MDSSSTDVPPARAMLASSLFAQELGAKHARQVLRTGCRSIDDDVLHGGFGYGRVTAISGGAGSGKTLMALEALTSHLLAHQTALAAVVDTTGGFSPTWFRDLVCARIRDAGSLQPQLPSGGEKIEMVRSVLDRVRVMRVFDFAGLVEAVDEVKGDLVGAGNDQGVGKSDVPMLVADSEGEEGDEDQEGDQAGANAVTSGRGGEMGLDIGMVIVDTMTNVTSAMMSHDHVKGTRSWHCFAE
ncbi:MAG: hypothetical protein M1838_000906 [Thelocarpon superellum]|nr:MAG: hypothetical protein M1838_000906 [Thelocarpon superellum]